MNFYPRSPCGERQLLYIISTPKSNFYPRSPCGERLVPWMTTGSRDTISIHALLAESDPPFRQGRVLIFGFLSTLSLRRATFRFDHCFGHNTFLSTLSLRRATTGNASGIHTHWISIHALLAESDRIFAYVVPVQYGISIHALLAESDTRQPPTTAPRRPFLSTLSLRRATLLPQPTPRPQPNFYPRSPCGERPDRPPAGYYSRAISIHALLAESDP